MRTSWRAILLLIVAATTLGGCGPKKSTGGVKTPAPAETTQVSKQLPGDQAALSAALGQPSQVHYQVVVVDDMGGLDKDGYLDKLLDERKWPQDDMLVLLVFPDAAHDIRFALGANFFAQKVTVDEVLGLVRSAYLPKARTDDPAGGLADLIQAVNQRMAR